MDHFENIIAGLLESDGYWVRRSFKVEVTKEEKRNIGKPSIPRPEIDLLAFKPLLNQVLAFEAKSYLDSPGVKVEDLETQHTIPEGRYKLFTCENYSRIVLARMKAQLIGYGMANQATTIKLGLAAGNIYRNDEVRLKALFQDRGWLLWTPAIIKERIRAFVDRDYENDASIITAKLLLR